MRHPEFRPRLTPAGVAGLLLVVLALVSQLALGAMALPDLSSERQKSDPHSVSILCRGGVPAQPDRHPTHQHGHAPDTALCPLSVALALPSVMLVLLPGLAPRAVLGRASHLQATRSARGPPSHQSKLGFPRGPPVQA